jgi:Zn-dependent M28 family amino/carboxypeptidase
MVFMAFSGEEAGLLGSSHFVKRQVFRPERIKFLTNIDIMGDASGGVTVVNATLFPKQFARLTAINDAKKYLPEIRSRGKAANSDHYHFSEIGVPAIFMYSIGGKGYYHDVFDRPAELSLYNVPGVAHLLIDFVEEF